LQAQIFALTNVPVERQKLMHKQKLIKDDKGLAAVKDVCSVSLPHPLIPIISISFFLRL
jgi:hypothetical protein